MDISGSFGRSASIAIRPLIKVPNYRFRGTKFESFGFYDSMFRYLLGETEQASFPSSLVAVQMEVKDCMALSENSIEYKSMSWSEFPLLVKIHLHV